MKIGLNGQKILIDKLAGPEVYTYNTFRAFAQLDTKNTYTLYFEKEPEKNVWDDLSQLNSNFSYKVVPKMLSWTQIGLALQLFKDGNDVFFGATHTIPVIHPKKTIMVSMIHGLEYEVNKLFYKNPFKKLVHPLILWWVIIFSKLIIAPSKATKDAIVNKRWFLVKENKIRIIHEGVNSSFYKREETETALVAEKYELKDKKYLLFVSTIQPRKNIPVMVNGFSKFLSENPEHKDVLLLISGKLGWLYQESLDSPKKFGVVDNVKFLGRTPDEDLPPLLSMAKGFISCSLEEGFGIPLLEAMACETPAVVSDIPAFKELAKDTAIYVKPKNPESVKKGIEELFIKGPDTEKVKKAKLISKDYTWENGGKQLISLFESFFKHF